MLAYQRKVRLWDGLWSRNGFTFSSFAFGVVWLTVYNLECWTRINENRPVVMGGGKEQREDYRQRIAESSEHAVVLER